MLDLRAARIRQQVRGSYVSGEPVYEVVDLYAGDVQGVRALRLADDGWLEVDEWHGRGYVRRYPPHAIEWVGVLPDA